MAVGRTEAEEGLAQRGEYRAGIASELGAEVLGPVEDAGLLEEIDAAIDLCHVLVGTEHIERELRRHRPAGALCRSHGNPRLGDSRLERRRDRALSRRADRTVGLAGTAARDGGREDAMHPARGP